MLCGLYSRNFRIFFAYSAPDNECLTENQVKDIADVTTIAGVNSDKTNRIEQKLPQEADAMSPACKRSKKATPERIEIIHNRNNTRSSDMNDNDKNCGELQADKDKDSHKNVGNLLREKDKIDSYEDRSISISNVAIGTFDECTNIATKTRMEYESVTHVITENRERREQLVGTPHKDDETDELLEKTSTPIAEESQEETAGKKIWQEEEEESDTDDTEMLNLFNDIPDSVM